MGDCCRCDAFRFFTPLRCAQNDRGESALRSGWLDGGAMGMTGWRWLRSGWQGRDAVFGMAEFGPCRFE